MGESQSLTYPRPEFSEFKNLWLLIQNICAGVNLLKMLLFIWTGPYVQLTIDNSHIKKKIMQRV